MERVTGRPIMEESFAIIERELGPHDFPPWAFAVVRRIIHASADFDFARSVRYHRGFEEAVTAALRAARPIVTDVEMVRVAIEAELRAAGFIPAGAGVHCFLNDASASELAKTDGLTRSAAGIRIAAQHLAEPLVVIGTAPTALDETLRLVETGSWTPAAIVAIPVGFVGVVEAKERLVRQDRIPYLTCVGRKGGSAVTAAAFNALVEWSSKQGR